VKGYELWGGPHDGDVIDVEGEPRPWRRPELVSAEEAGCGGDCRGRHVRVSTYRFVPERGRYEFTCIEHVALDGEGRR